MNETYSECIVCERAEPNGIRIFGQFICQQCEQNIVHTDVCDELYPHYIECMKRIWLAATS